MAETTIYEDDLINEIRNRYGSVSKMISLVQNKIHDMKKYGGYEGMDGADVLERALGIIPSDYHSIYYRYAHSYPRP